MDPGGDYNMGISLQWGKYCRLKYKITLSPVLVSTLARICKSDQPSGNLLVDRLGRLHTLHRVSQIIIIFKVSAEL